MVGSEIHGGRGWNLFLAYQALTLICKGNRKGWGGLWLPFFCGGGLRPPHLWKGVKAG